MKFVIKEEEPKEEIVELYLVREGDEVSLQARNKDDEKTLIVFRNGKYIRIEGAQIDGIETDEKGKIEEV